MLKKIILSIGMGIILFAFLNPHDYNFAQDAVQKSVMIIASRDFRDEELLLPKDMLETNRVAVTLASSSLAPSSGMLGTVVKPEILLKDVNVEDYDAVIFVGGRGAKEFWDDPQAQRIALEAQANKKVIGAICIAPVILAKAGILKEKKATVWSGGAGELQAQGAIYTGSDLEVTGNIITANGPDASVEFAEALVKALVRRR